MNLSRHAVVSLLATAWVLAAMAARADAQTQMLEEDWPASAAARPAAWTHQVLKQTVAADSQVQPASATVAKRPSKLRLTASQQPSPIELPDDPAYNGFQIQPGQIGPPEMIPPGVVMEGPPCGDCYAGCGGCDIGGCDIGCGGGGCGGHGGGKWWLRDFSVFFGVHGFKGPPDGGVNGNFGFQEGVNLGLPTGIGCWGFQVGVAAVHSNFERDQVWGDGRLGDRDQVFVTTGVFRRAPCGGFQWGVVFDLLHDTYDESVNLKQVRSETGYVFSGGRREIGYYGAYGVGDDSEYFYTNGREWDLQLDPTDMFIFYYRRYFCGGGDGRLWAGFSGRGDGLIGADLRAPLGKGWAIENRINYLIPEEGKNNGAQAEESWGLTIQLVWYIGQPAQCALKSQYRPLLDVADNSLFMVDRLGGDVAD